MKRVLVIDDDPAIARLVQTALWNADVEHTLEYCSDGSQGRLMAARGGYDLITLDLAMPFMDGTEALREMRGNPKSASIPTVVITALEDAQLHQQVKELGAAAVITKPFEIWELVSILKLVMAGQEVKPPTPPGEGDAPGMPRVG